MTTALENAHLLFVESNRSGFGRSLIEYAVDAGCEVTFASHLPEYFLDRDETPETSFLARCKNIIRIDTHNNLHLLYDNLARYCADAGVHAVIATSDAEIVQAAHIAARAGLFGTAPGAVEAANLKHLTRGALAAAGVPQPAFRVVPTVEEAVTAAAEIGFPCVVKAVDASDSISVTLASCADDVRRAHAEHFRTGMYSREVRKLGVMLVEEFVAGPLYSLEVLADRGVYRVLGVTDRLLSAPPVFVELGAGFPVTGGPAPALTAAGLAALRAIGYDNGPAHIEMVLAADGPRIIEINPRIIGNSIPDVIARCMDIDIRRTLLELYLGRGLPGEFVVGRAGYTRSIAAGAAGVLREVTVGDLPDDVEVHLKDRLGAPVRPPQTNQDRLGRVVAYAPTVEQARVRAEEALGGILLEVD
ncbi:ATP-grasp domain-containing protein [Catellatospora bangladeshensis]|uniref:Argininosuccinate lyase n=1 Tax=Catellatospora bangladeshensis TaxID=310355 RepID=A0A8J3JGW2_9ACTN|nr:ATP-grasp domain-containing protein [Catellatospora bangladeshensis]GIF84366.1 argininosuccinate lyase [Catellatospora bangladeshensis]